MQTLTHAAPGAPRISLGRLFATLGPSLDGLALLSAAPPLLAIALLHPDAAAWTGLLLLPLAILVAMGALEPRPALLVSRRAVAPLLWLLRHRALPMPLLLTRGAGCLAVGVCFLAAMEPGLAPWGLAGVAALGLAVTLQDRTLLALTVLAPLAYPFVA